MYIFERAKVRKMNREITDIIELKQILEDHVAVLVYFYSDSCQPCIMLRPKIGKMIIDEFPKMKMVKINSMLYPDIPANWNVFSSPTIIVMFEGKEYIRKSQYISISELSDNIKRLYEMMF